MYSSIMYLCKKNPKTITMLLELGSIYDLNIIHNYDNFEEEIAIINPDIVIISTSYTLPEVINIINISKNYNKNISIMLYGKNAIKTEYMKLDINDFIPYDSNIDLLKLRINNQIKIINYINKIKQLIDIDELTGMPNQTAIYKYANALFKNAARQKHTVSVIILKLNQYDEMVNTYGYQFGDMFLVYYSNIIKSLLKRESDFVGKLQSSNYAMIFYNISQKDTLNIINYLKNMIESINSSIDNISIKTTISLGYCCDIPKNCQDIDKFFVEAGKLIL